MPLLKNPLEQYYLVQGGFKRTDLNDTESDSTTLVASRYWDLSSGWQRAINLRWSLDHFTQGEITNTTMLFYPRVMISRTRSRGGLMPTSGRLRNATLSTTPTRPGAQMSISPFSGHKTSGSAHCMIAIVFVTRAARWAGLKPVISTKYRRICVSSPGGDRSIRGYKYKSIAPKYSNGDLKGASKLITGSLEYQYNVTGKWWGRGVCR